MCGRFACSLCPNALRNKLIDSNVLVSKEWNGQAAFYPSFNVGPRSYIPVIRRSGDELVLQAMKWGFIPCWAKQAPDRQPINARDDTLSGQSMFDHAKNKGRCVVVAEGFYEWKQLANGKSIPYYTKRKDGKLMLFAGLYDVSQIEDQQLYTCTIITTSASSFFEVLHTRMPVILENGSSDVDIWLSDQPWGKEHVQIMHPFEGMLDCYQVTDAVGNTKNNSADFVVPVDQLKGSISNFLQKQGTKRKRLDKAEKPIVSDAKKHDAKDPSEKSATRSVKMQNRGKITSFFKKN
ncbi:hypothetical protein BJV82DRAFT_518398 [Fennellomyces sp. T-0311]|nr:hypothetical protein BJV82DRAFT_518398 [Fennellomyces sp. T-0311]